MIFFQLIIKLPAGLRVNFHFIFMINLLRAVLLLLLVFAALDCRDFKVVEEI